MGKSYRELKYLIEKETLDQIDFTKELADEEIYGKIDDALLAHSERHSFPPGLILALREEVYCSLKKMDVLQEFLDDETITEVMINGTDNIFIERNGSLIETDKYFISKEKLEDIIQQIVAGCNRAVNEANPIVDARLSSGERVNIVLPPVALNGPIVTIRRFPKVPITMEKLIEYGTLSYEVAGFLKKLVVSKYNIFISGGTGSGKTTVLNALSQYIPSDERIITIEDSAELQIQGIKNLVRLETRSLNSENCREITIRDLIKTALRMRPERIVVGEVRGAEAMDMLQAMNTGHDGSLSTGHANSTEDMLTRLETMVLMGMELPLKAIRGQIASGIDIIVHLGRMRDKSRKIVEISEIEKMEGGEIILNRLYELNGNHLINVGELKNRDKWMKVFGEK